MSDSFDADFARAYPLFGEDSDALRAAFRAAGHCDRAHGGSSYFKCPTCDFTVSVADCLDDAAVFRLPAIPRCRAGFLGGST